MASRRIGPVLLLFAVVVSSELVLQAKPAAAQALVVMVPAGGGAQWDDLWTRPGDSKGIYIYVGIGDPSNPYLIPNLTLYPYSAGVYAQEGGHNHGGAWPFGSLSPGAASTGPNGEPAYFVFTAGSAGGMMWPMFWVEYLGQPSILTTINGMIVGETASGYPDLGSGDFVKIGWTSAHPDNHRGEWWFIDTLHQLASNYHAVWPEHGVLAYNDLSLIRGGVFDINQNYNPPHNLHRTGEDIDVRANNAPNAIPHIAEVRDWFVSEVERLFGRPPLLESAGTGNEHYHIFGR